MRNLNGLIIFKFYNIKLKDCMIAILLSGIVLSLAIRYCRYKKLANYHFRQSVYGDGPHNIIIFSEPSTPHALAHERKGLEYEYALLRPWVWVDPAVDLSTK